MMAKEESPGMPLMTSFDKAKPDLKIMAIEEKRACLWYAFNTLADQGKDTGIKSQLKVGA